MSKTIFSKTIKNLSPTIPYLNKLIRSKKDPFLQLNNLLAKKFNSFKILKYHLNITLAITNLN